MVGQFFDVPAIEQQLAELRWGQRPAGGTGEAAEHAAAEARASTITLVAVARTSAEERLVSQTLAHMSAHHPSRTLILLAQEDRGSSKLEATVSSFTEQSPERPVFNEQVMIHAHGQVAEHLASIVAPLLVPDLPVMLWWHGTPAFESRLFNELADLCDRLIIDSDDVRDPTREFERLLHVAKRRTARIAVGDFNWARLLPWRQVAAQFFDPPRVRDQLRLIESVEVCSGKGSDAQARLMAGWFQARLAPLGVPVERIIKQEPDGPTGLIRLEIRANRGQARFSIRGRPNECLVTDMEMEGHNYPERTVRIATRDPADLLAVEMVESSHDAVYEEALKYAAR
ncbi:MAG: glucose-6-phosphate dehydrogenase assembly protein OpcA [Candidatus Dormibacteria bacterium]